MHEKHLRTIDLNLLPVLEALLRHRNVTRAGEEVGLSQPAMSRALGRLRDLLEDPLLVRSPAGYLLSPRADALRQPLAMLLGQLGGMLVEPMFDPAAERRLLRLAMSDAQAERLLAPLVRRLTIEAPGVIVEWVPIGPGLPERMRAGEIDLAFALDSTPLPQGLVSEPFEEDRLAVVTRAGHPAGAAWTMADYADYPSVIVSLLGDRASDMDAELAAAGVTRAIAAIVPTFRAAVEVVAVTDNITTVSRAFAAKLAGPLGLTLIEPPLRHARLGLVAVWSQHRTNDPVLAWLRRMLHGVIRADGP
jgi:DNA-binding transcriptional LysR family regulator